MTRDDVKVNLPRWGAILGIVLALLSIAAVAVNAGDDRYAKRHELEEVKAMAKDILCSAKVEPGHWRCRQ